MGTITIQSNNTGDLQFLSDLAFRLGLKAKIDVPEIDIKVNQLEEPTIDYEDTPEGIVDGVKQGLQFVKELDAGLHKEQTLREMLDEN